MRRVEKTKSGTYLAAGHGLQAGLQAVLRDEPGGVKRESLVMSPPFLVVLPPKAASISPFRFGSGCRRQTPVPIRPPGTGPASTCLTSAVSVQQTARSVSAFRCVAFLSLPFAAFPRCWLCASSAFRSPTERVAIAGKLRYSIKSPTASVLSLAPEIEKLLAEAPQC